MEFIAAIRPYMRIFYLFGLSLFPLHYYLREPKQKVSKWLRFALVIPTIIWCAFKCCLCATCFYMVNICGEQIGYTDSIMTNIFLVCELLKALSVFMQNFFYSDTCAVILQNFQTSEFFFENMLNRPISFVAFHRAYFKKICFAFGMYAAVSIFFVLRYLSLDYVDLPFVLIQIMHFTSIGVHVNVVFFIDLISYNLRHLNLIIAKDTSEKTAENLNVFVVKKVKTAEMIRERLSKYKLIHFHLWRMTEQVNEIFGCVLIVLSLQTFADLVYNVIWQLNVLHEEWNFINFIRKILVKMKFLAMKLDGNMFFSEPTLNFISIGICGLMLLGSSHNCHTEVTIKQSLFISLSICHVKRVAIMMRTTRKCGLSKASRNSHFGAETTLIRTTQRRNWSNN